MTLELTESVPPSLRPLRFASSPAWPSLALALLSTVAVSCGSDDDSNTGSVSILLEAEDVITAGIAAGTGASQIQDGWSVTFDKYLATVGDIDLHLSGSQTLTAQAHDAWVVDLKQLPPAGLPLWTIDGLKAGRWEFYFSTVGAAHEAARHATVSQSDFDEMVQKDFTYYIDGVITKASGQSCPPAALATPGNKAANGNTSGTNPCYDAPSVRFTFGASAETLFGPCVIDGVPGFAVAANTTQTVAVTIHGDHLFFNGFPEGDEGGVSRYAQWLADSDLNLDGVVTWAELEAIQPSALPELDARYQLGGSPIDTLNTMADYVTAQLKTQGHFQGEGECPIDGTEHTHD